MGGGTGVRSFLESWPLRFHGGNDKCDGCNSSDVRASDDRLGLGTSWRWRTPCGPRQPFTHGHSGAVPSSPVARLADWSEKQRGFSTCLRQLTHTTFRAEVEQPAWQANCDTHIWRRRNHRSISGNLIIIIFTLRDSEGYCM